MDSPPRSPRMNVLAHGGTTLQHHDKIKNGELTRRDGEGAGLVIEQMGPSGPVPVTLGQG